MLPQFQFKYSVCVSANEELIQIIREFESRKIFVLADENTALKCLPLLNVLLDVAKYPEFILKPGETHKTIETAEQIWKFLIEQKADRHSLLICLGGGVVTDLGGFVASLFKRGIACVHIPTTLMAMVDAAHGGKNGVNFKGIKNQIGVIQEPYQVIVSPEFLRTLNLENILSGYAEMIKHALLSDPECWEQLAGFSPNRLTQTEFLPLLRQSIEVKKYYVLIDPLEVKLRKALNLGHTTGHALESVWMRKGMQLLHGTALAHGLKAELFLSHKWVGLDMQIMLEVTSCIENWYGKLTLEKEEIEYMLDFMAHDKKNRDNQVCFTLLSDFGKPAIDQFIPTNEIKACLEYVFLFT